MIVISSGELKFPDGFLWGVATSHFQVEGNPKEMAGRLSDWSMWTNCDGKIIDKSNADKACEFFYRYKDDLALCQNMNMSAFRLSLNWAALVPLPGAALDREMVDYYRKVLTEIRAKGMKSFVSLFHFCLPNWLADIGGWTNPKTVREFARFAELCAQEFGDLVDFWITINEPLVYAYQSYIAGVWTPGYEGDFLLAFKTIRSMLEGHAAAYHEIHSNVKDAQVSFAIHWRIFSARNPLNPLDQFARYLRNHVFNHIFLLAIREGRLIFPFPINCERVVQSISGPITGLKDSMDYIGLNYYTHETCEFQWAYPPDFFGQQAETHQYAKTGLGWEIYPQGLYDVLTKELPEYSVNSQGKKLPTYITENGMATKFPAHMIDGDWSLNDTERVNFLTEHIKAMHRAIADGANVKGYLHWSLLDNFEWADGLEARFGLVRVTFPTQERTMRESAKVYTEIARNNGLGMQMLEASERAVTSNK